MMQGEIKSFKKISPYFSRILYLRSRFNSFCCDRCWVITKQKEREEGRRKERKGKERGNKRCREEGERVEREKGQRKKVDNNFLSAFVTIYC